MTYFMIILSFLFRNVSGQLKYYLVHEIHQRFCYPAWKKEHGSDVSYTLNKMSFPSIVIVDIEERKWARWGYDMLQMAV